MTIKRVVTYLRVSTVNQIDNTSIETQREKINLYCKLNDYEIIEEFIDDVLCCISYDEFDEFTIVCGYTL